ncbi:hypothetical protein MRX96_054559 [Rhipicephalus microplus]
MDPRKCEEARFRAFPLRIRKMGRRGQRGRENEPARFCFRGGSRAVHYGCIRLNRVRGWGSSSLISTALKEPARGDASTFLPQVLRSSATSPVTTDALRHYTSTATAFDSALHRARHTEACA